MRELTSREILAFRRKVFRFYKQHGRKLPFRYLDDCYAVTVSELMLQQTQVTRVVPKYKDWVVRWSDWRSLARATNKQLLAAWSGLGYNRRALYLGEMANIIVQDYDGLMPNDPDQLLALPGIGRYTSRAILIFAHNKPLVAIDTNIRRLLIHEFNLDPKTTMRELERFAERLLPRGRSREWHYALMDYGSLKLPRILPDTPPISRQTRFEGSARQIRGEIVRQLTIKSRVKTTTVANQLDRKVAEVVKAARSLEKEEIIALSGETLRLRNS
jgi:A/G-specific adenine glycosylase